MTGWTVVTREPEWDDAQRERLLALGIYEDGMCSCGFHSSQTNDLSNFFTFEDKRCAVCAASEKYGRMQQAGDEAEAKSHGEKVPPGLTLTSDGRRTFVRQLSPTEVAAVMQPGGSDRGRSQ